MFLSEKLKEMRLKLRGEKQVSWKTAGIAAICALGVVSGCSPSERKLPILGERTWEERTVDGKTVTDTVYHTIPSFAFVSQYGDTVTEKNFENKIYITDFFFTSCPTICPVMKKNMIKVYKAIRDKEDVAILSHTIDPRHDTPEVLKKYAEDLGVSGRQWLFVTGPKEKIYEIGQGSYLVSAKEDDAAAGGFIHSGAFVLVDRQKRVRGMYDGTDEKSVARLLEDVDVLRKEDSAAP